MRFSFIRTSAAVVVASIALAACGGRGVVPTSSVPGMTGNVAPAAASPCAYAKLPWYFKGACVATTLTSKGGTVKLPAYKNITASITLGANTASGKVNFIVGDATGHKDITPLAVTKAFPKYSQTTCSSKNGCPGTPIFYLEAANGSKATITFSKSTTFQVKAPFPSTASACGPALINAKLKWTSYVLVVGAKPKNGVLKMSIPDTSVSNFQLVPGATYITILCQISNGA